MSVDWSSVSYINEILQGLIDRHEAVFGLGTGGSLISVGDDVQAASFWYGIQLEIELHLVPNYLNMSVGPLTAAKTGFLYWTSLGAVRSVAGLTGTDWTRKGPRELTSLVAATDLYGNTVADGQQAIFGGVFYRRIAGVWTAGNYAPDLLTSGAAGPNAYGARGKMLSGDYIGEWIFDEIRKTMNQLKWTVEVNGTFTTQDSYYSSGNVTNNPNPPTNTEWTAAFGAATGAWPGANLGPPWTHTATWTKFVLGYNWPTANEALFEILGNAGVVQASPSQTTSGVARTVDWYGLIHITLHMAVDAQNVLDGQGDFTFANGAEKYNLLFTDALTSSATVSHTISASAHSLNPPPNYPNAASLNGHYNSKGYEVGDLEVVLKWDFPTL